MHRVLQFNQSQWSKSCAEFNTKNKSRKAEKQKNGDKDGKALHKLMNNVVKIMKNFRNRIYVKAKRLTRKKIFQNGHQDQAIWQ